ncbi:MAG: MarR family transcriptional regulator [Ezakiella sp.]|nr:MarR family transcriptional regulator [Ezakiella sp.]MDD7471570.1 MarR family transcriptional regulator [Bacillota bacterium]MDY3922806.1 MarR family transcriptional regulator [Ezakiella sp.]
MDIELKILIALHRTINKIDKKTIKLANNSGLTFGQFMVLEALYSKGDMSIGEVMDKILSSVGTISVIVNNLVKAGYVEKIPYVEDKRVTMLHLTDDGRGVIEKVIPENYEMIAESFSMLTEDEKESLLLILKKIGGFYGKKSN